MKMKSMGMKLRQERNEEEERAGGCDNEANISEIEEEAVTVKVEGPANFPTPALPDVTAATDEESKAPNIPSLLLTVHRDANSSTSVKQHPLSSSKE